MKISSGIFSVSLCSTGTPHADSESVWRDYADIGKNVNADLESSLVSLHNLIETFSDSVVEIYIV